MGLLAKIRRELMFLVVCICFLSIFYNHVYLAPVGNTVKKNLNVFLVSPSIEEPSKDELTSNIQIPNILVEKPEQQEVGTARYRNRKKEAVHRYHSGNKRKKKERQELKEEHLEAQVNENPLESNSSSSIFLKPAKLKAMANLLKPSSVLYKFLKEQKQRSSKVARECEILRKNTFTRKNLGRSSHFRNLIADEKTHLMYCPVYKAASTTWLTSLLQLHPEVQVHPSVRMQVRLKRVFPGYVSKTLNKSKWMWNETTKFMVVRHPITRLVSCFRDKFENASKKFYYERFGQAMIDSFRKVNPLKTDIHNELFGGRESVSTQSQTTIGEIQGPTFLEFVQFVVKGRRVDEHWRPYYKHCSPCDIEYDFILRFESLDRENKLFIRYLNQSSIIKTGHKNRFHGASTSDELVCSYVGQLSEDVFKKLINMYAIDYQLFGYNTSDYSQCVKGMR